MKKQFLTVILLFISILGTVDIHANSTVVKIYLKQAKKLYNETTGPLVKNEGAAGHLYRTGKSIVCIYTDVDMDDAYGHSIPMQDPRRYECKMQFDNNGLASSLN